VKALPRCSERSPRGLKAKEGIEWSVRFNRCPVTTDRCPERHPEVGVGGTGTAGATRWEENPGNGMRVGLVDEARPLGSGENP
jgi:hypothetical protein